MFQEFVTNGRPIPPVIVTFETPHTLREAMNDAWSRAYAKLGRDCFTAARKIQRGTASRGDIARATHTLPKLDVAGLLAYRESGYGGAGFSRYIVGVRRLRAALNLAETQPA